MQCPMCMSKRTAVDTTRDKDRNKHIKVSNLPKNIEMYDYRVRKRYCKDCKYEFSTVETYFNPEDIFMLNENMKLAEQKTET